MEMEVECQKCNGKAVVKITSVNAANRSYRWGYYPSVASECISPEKGGSACKHLDSIAMEAIEAALFTTVMPEDKYSIFSNC
jgi:hypothetical protein